MKNSYGIIIKDFKGLTTYAVTDDAEMAINRANVCRQWNSLCDEVSGKMKSCVVFFSGEYDVTRDKLILYKNGYIVDEFFEVI